MDLESIRREYLSSGLTRDGLLENPFDQFNAWMKQAVEMGLRDPTAMTLATSSSSGQPSQRIVLLKRMDEKGLIFFTNYKSRKAKDIAENANVSLHFPWHEIERQVKICGIAEKIPAGESLKYFLTRPRESQIAAWASSQSNAISSRTFLLNQFETIKHKFTAGEVPLPDFWGGFRVIPCEIEFWQGGENRLHDRFRYNLQDDESWKIQRLAP